jgi:hypothetical protein
MASGMLFERAYGKMAAMPSATISRAASISRDPLGRPPTTSTRHCALNAEASSIARLLPSIAACQPSGPSAENMPPRQ